MLCFIQFIHNAAKIGLRSFTINLLLCYLVIVSLQKSINETILPYSYPMSHITFDLFVRFFFAINCGGPQLIDSSTKFVFRGDNETLDAASFYMNSEENWGVSTTGIFLNSSDSTNKNGNPYMIEQGSVLGTT
jgi:hypothetical protein